jgi:AraC-like DNA-binding protein
MLRPLVLAARAANVDIGDLLAAHSLEPAQLQDPYGRLPHAFAVSLWEELPRRLGDEAFGLHLAQRLPRGSHDVLDYAMSNAPDLGSCYRIFLRYQRLVHEASAFGLELEEQVARLTHIWVASPALPRHISEYAMAMMLLFGRRLLGEEWAPQEVRFPHPAPADTREHQRLFRAPVHFGAAHSELVFDRRLLERRVPAADPTLSAVLERFMQELYCKLPAEENLLDQVRRCILEGLREEVPDAARVAKRLGLSERSLFRRLRALGTSYQQLVDEVRRDVATRQLREGQLSISEIAFLLAYSEVSAFHRAFRRWTGQSPAEYRLTARGAVGSG